MSLRLAALLAVSALGALQAGEPAWLTDLDQGRQQAARTGRPLLVYFTGSTWCGPCKALHAEVLPSLEFAAFARATSS
jgi:thiol-disulfide isomerase/thioredoxin